MIDASPSALTFAATQGGAPPAAQTVSITNGGGGSLSWTATADQPWISVSPATGIAPSTPSVTVSSAGLAPGSYSGTVTIAAVGGVITPRTVAVTLTVAPASTALLANGGFEGGSTGWVRGGTAQSYVQSGPSAHGGTGYVTLGTIDNGSGLVAQQVTIPASGTVTLSYWLMITSAETARWAADALFVEIRSTTGALLQTVATHSNLTAADFASYAQQTVTLSGLAGQTVRLQFRTQTSATLATTFHLDDVALTAL